MLILLSKKSYKDKDIVLTGQYLGVVEEFLPDKQSTFIKDGKIFASKTGTINVNDQERKIEISTHQEKDRKVVKVGDTVKDVQEGLNVGALTIATLEGTQSREKICSKGDPHYIVQKTSHITRLIDSGKIVLKPYMTQKA